MSYFIGNILSSRIERQQLASIFELLRKQEEQHNLKNMDENEFQAQLGLYR